MREYLEKFIKSKKSEVEELRKKSDAASEVAEVRAIGSELEKLQKEIADAESQLANLHDEEREEVPADAELRNADIVGTFVAPEKKEVEKMEYRQAFMEYVCHNTPIPAELRADAVTKTSDVGAVIPTQLINTIIEKFDNVGMIMPLVTKTAFKAGITIPTSTAKPVATFVAESASSDKQKKTTGSITFTNHKLRCEISMSMEVGTMALSAFEARFVDNVVKAMTSAIENAIINGSGTGCPKGILAETAPTGQALEITAAKIAYKDIVAWEAAIPEEYEGTAKWCMSKKTFMQIMAIVDKDEQPVARVNYGINGRIERTLLGREVVFASKYMPALAAGKAETVAFAFDFNDYMLNTIYDMGITKKQDWDTEDLLTKAVMSVDGKVVSKESLVTVANKLS